MVGLDLLPPFATDMADVVAFSSHKSQHTVITAIGTSGSVFSLITSIVHARKAFLSS
jgi:hypothetical protein